MANKKPNKPREKHVSFNVHEDMYDWLAGKMTDETSLSQVVRGILRQAWEQEGFKGRKKAS